MQVLRVTLLGSALVLVLAPGLAWAGNGIHPRTPVEWEPEPACMTVVDRSVDPIYQFNYTILMEDLRPENAVDEVPDSRRHQFIGFCRGHSPQQPLTAWLSAADVEAAKQVGIVDGVVEPDEILESMPEWKDCFFRITPDDQRRPITFAEAAKPVVWDTTGLAPGAYVINGYTWEPVFNIWSVRPGVVKVIDDPDPAASPPALAISNGEEIKYPDEIFSFTGCVDAMDGSTVTGYYAVTGDGDVLDWKSFAADTPVDGDSFELQLMPPVEAVGQQMAIKVEITDPMDRTYTAHMRELAAVLDGSGDSGECMESGFISMPGCDGSESGEEDESGVPTTGAAGSTGPGATGNTGDSGATGETGDAGVNMQPGDGGCGGCALGGEGSPALLVGPWLLWARRRRRSATSPSA